jgi:hypothetical protein
MKQLILFHSLYKLQTICQLQKLTMWYMQKSFLINFIICFVIFVREGNRWNAHMLEMSLSGQIALIVICVANRRGLIN